MESAFLLSGYGEQGFALLGKALRQTESKKSARDLAIYLQCAGPGAVAAVSDMVASLDRNWRDTRQRVLLALLNIAEVNPQAIEPYMSQIAQYVKHRDSDTRCKVYLIERAIQNAKRPESEMPSDDDSTQVNALSNQNIKTDRIVAGRVLDIHMLGSIEETVTVCHFDPRYVVVVQTETGVKRLAIHSPALTFMEANPVGKRYRFHLSKRDRHFLLGEVVRIEP